MDRNELVTLLNTLVRRNRITRTEADTMLAAYDAGELEQLPAAPDADGGDWLAALALLLLLVNGSPRRPLPLRVRQRAQRLLRGDFDNTMRQLANQVAGGTLTVAAWQAQVQTALSSYTRQMAIAGRGRLPRAALQQLVDTRLVEQWSFLDGFAAEQMARAAAERPMSPAQIANRSRMYGAVGWGAFFLAQGEVAEPGFVEQYITRDDRGVCRLCAPRHLQYYLPSQGPMPGECLGICRCERVPVYAPDIYAQLTGQPLRRAA